MISSPVKIEVTRSIDILDDIARQYESLLARADWVTSIFLLSGCKHGGSGKSRTESLSFLLLIQERVSYWVTGPFGTPGFTWIKRAMALRL